MHQIHIAGGLARCPVFGAGKLRQVADRGDIGEVWLMSAPEAQALYLLLLSADTPHCPLAERKGAAPTAEYDFRLRWEVAELSRQLSQGLKHGALIGAGRWLLGREPRGTHRIVLCRPIEALERRGGQVRVTPDERGKTGNMAGLSEVASDLVEDLVLGHHVEDPILPR